MDTRWTTKPRRQLEHGFWTDDADFSRRNVAQNALMVLPGMALDKAASIETISAARPSRYRLSRPDVRSSALRFAR
jgi:hypothetical protein